MAQQTAIQWIEEKFNKWAEGKKFILHDYFEIAKQKEKEQRVKDYNAGYTDAQCNHVNDAENYVNEQEYLNN